MFLPLATPHPLKMETNLPRVWECPRPTCLARMLTLEETTDVSLVGVDGKNPLRGHKVVLASVSDFFMRLFFGEGRESWEENAKGVVSFKEFSSEAVRLIVDIVYIRRVEIAPDQSHQPLLELLGASDFLNIPELKECCHYFLGRHGKQIVQNELQDLSLPLLRKTLASDALGCEEIVIFKAVEQWIEARKASLGEDDIKEILGMVRYGLIPAKELVSVVGVSKWKDEALLFSALDNWIEPDVAKLKVPQHLARANTFPLLPFAAGALCVAVEEGAYLYQIEPLSQHRLPREGHPYAGVLLAVDNLEVPITLSSQLHRLSFSFSVFPEINEQAVAFSPDKYLTLVHTSTGSGPLHGSLLGARHQSLGLGAPTVHQPGLLSASYGGNDRKFVISKRKDVIEMAQDPLVGNIIKHPVCSNTKHVLFGVKVNEPASLKLVSSS